MCTHVHEGVRAWNTVFVRYIREITQLRLLYCLLLSLIYSLDFQPFNQYAFEKKGKELNLLQKTVLELPAGGLPSTTLFPHFTQNVKPTLKWCGSRQDAGRADKWNRAGAACYMEYASTELDVQTPQARIFINSG